MLAHRGPDGEGVLDLGHAILAHRRLAVIDPSPSGAQPMRTEPGAGGAITYNGELYNDAQLRQELDRVCPAPWRTTCDTETVARAFAVWGARAAESLRGMFALGYVSAGGGTLLLARDGFGMKPLYLARCRGVGGDVYHLVFASELPALLALREAIDSSQPRPDVIGVSAYLTTIRTTLGSRTMFEGVECVQPGEVLEVDLSHAQLRTKRYQHDPAEQGKSRYVAGREIGRLTRETIEASVVAHLRSDVPICVLLSGGLDSSIVASIARRHVPNLKTFCAGVRDPQHPELTSPDLEVAARWAAQLGSEHREAVVDERMFVQHWTMLVDRVGYPLSTPNEAAIFEVARVLRECGCVVTLSGEGADELFGGYDLALDAASQFEAQRALRGTASSPGTFALAGASWIALAQKAGVLTPEAWRAAEHDASLIAWAEETFAKVSRNDDDDPLRAHLRWQQQTNLVGLLQRLDTATMHAGVEGRTPFADLDVLRLSESLPMASLYRREGQPHPRGGGWRTKVALREAFGEELSEEIVRRPKASFPLPFQQWVGGAGLRDLVMPGQSPALESLVRREVLDGLAANPSAAWHVAWPVMNLALWCKRWWG
jgi:asparagine synthase (glutamine-hydrolysing)